MRGWGTAWFWETGVFFRRKSWTTSIKRVLLLVSIRTIRKFREWRLVPGSLGHGLGLALGIALAKKLDRREERVFALLSDGEMCEGSVWEATA